MGKRGEEGAQRGREGGLIMPRPSYIRYPANVQEGDYYFWECGCWFRDGRCIQVHPEGCDRHKLGSWEDGQMPVEG
jgi:hypothetical protein